MKYLALAVIFLAGCATEKGNIRQAQHSADQIKMVAVQREAQMKEKQAEADSNKQLYDSLARICEANKEHCPATTVALAVIGALGAESDDDDDAPIVQLQQQRDVGLEYVKVLATPVSTLLTGVAIAGIQSDVAKNSSDNNRDILLGDQQADLGIVQAVAGLGSAAANSVGIQADGYIYQVSDNGAIDNSQNTTDSYNTTTSTETNQAYTSSFSLATTLNYEGASMSLSDLITQLQNAGASYSIDLDGDGTPDVEGGDGEPTVVINCDEPQFSPAPPECSAT